MHFYSFKAEWWAFFKAIEWNFFLSAFLHFLAFMCMQIMAPNLIKYIWLMSFLYHIVFKKYQVFKLWFQMCNLIYVGCSKSKSCPFQKLSWEFNLMTFQYWDNIWRTHNFIRRTTTICLAFEDCFKIMKLLWYYCVLKWNEPVLFLVKFIPKLLDHKTNIKILSTLAIQPY